MRLKNPSISAAVLDPHAPSPKEITKHEPNYVLKHKGEQLSTATIKASQLGPYQILRYPRSDSTLLPKLLFPVIQSLCYGISMRRAWQ